MATIKPKFPKISQGDIDSLERKVNIKIPGDYKKFLIRNNGADVSPNVFNVPGKGGFAFSSFFGIADGIDGIEYILKTFKGRYPDGFFPIGRDMSGNLLLIGAAKNNDAQIFFWDHETEQDAGVKPDTSNIKKISGNLKGFIDDLHEPDPVLNGNLTDIFNGPDDGIKALLATGWDINKPGESGETLIQRAVLKDKVWLVQLLVERGAKLNGTIAQTMTFDNLKILELLLKAGANIEERDDNEYTPLEAAVIGKKTDMVKFLLKHGADKSVRDEFGDTPLDTAVVKKENGEDMDEIIKLLKG